MDISTDDYIKSAIEALLFINEKPITVEQLKESLESVSAGEIKKYINELITDYDDNKRGMIITEIAGGYQMMSHPAYAAYVRNFYKVRVKERLSRPALETLAIITYKQPVSRSDIEEIRGVNSDGVVVHLLNKNLIKVVGRKDVPGRPYIYGTTKQFLDYFGLRSLTDLPKLEDFPALMIKKEEQQDVSFQAKENLVQSPEELKENQAAGRLAEEVAVVDERSIKAEENKEAEKVAEVSAEIIRDTAATQTTDVKAEEVVWEQEESVVDNQEYGDVEGDEKDETSIVSESETSEEKILEEDTQPSDEKSEAVLEESLKQESDVVLEAESGEENMKAAQQQQSEEKSEPVLDESLKEETVVMESEMSEEKVNEDNAQSSAENIETVLDENLGESGDAASSVSDQSEEKRDVNPVA